MRDRQFFNTQLNVLHSRAIAERVVDKLKLKDQPAFQGARGRRRRVPGLGGGRAGARDLRGRGEDHPQRPQGRGAVGQHARRRLHGLQHRGPGRGGQARLQVGHRAAGRDPDRDAAGPGQAAQELPGPGPVRARGQRLGDHHLDHQADRGPHPGPGPAHRARGPARRVRRRRAAAGAALDAIPQVAGDAVGRRDQRQDPVAERGPRAAAREVQGRPPRGPEDPGADRSSCARTRTRASARSRRACAPSTASSSARSRSSSPRSTTTRAAPPTRA